ncbi:hypothetical protein EV424DRAFT_1347585 [Suillus variegatus]|nr:hypothetical protein EV424DRAFT_1347585 [Suillus variegatus]
MNHAGPGADDEDLLQELVPAFQQTPPVQLLYLQAAIAHIIRSSTVAEATNQIQDGLDLIELCGALPTFPIPRRSIITVKKHLGLQTDDYVLRIPICDVCYKHYSLDDIQKLDTPICTVSRCKGSVYRTKREHTDPATGEDRFKRIPVKVLVYCPIIKAVQRFLLRSTFVSNLRDTSQDIDHTELSDDNLMHDIHNGTEWMKLEVGLKRVCLPDGSITDIEESPGSRRPLVCCDVGLSMTLNIDWFGITEGRPHSSGAVYISFNNLHQSRLREVHAAVLCENSDIPATRKLTGTAGHSHKTHPCNFCFISLIDIDSSVAYDITNFHMRDDWKLLEHAHRSKLSTTKAARKSILDEHGVRYSVLNELPALVKRFLFDIVTTGHLLDSTGWDLFQDSINSVIWPSGIGRLPKNLADDHGLPKADQWRRLLSIYPFILWLCWRDHHDEIKASAPPVPASVKPQPTFKRDLRTIYKLVLYLSVSERILASKAISINDIDRGQAYLQLYCQGLESLGVHQTINSHLAMHYSLVFRQYGPAYATWLFGFERFNGVLEDVNLNGHGGGEMEYSLARDWVEKHRLYELAISLPEGASDKEHKLIQRAIDQKGLDRGTLRTQIAQFTSASSILPPRLTSKTKFTSLRGLQHPQYKFPDLNVVDDMTAELGTTVLFASRSAKVLPFIVKDGIRFGSATATRTNADQFAGVLMHDTRVPCKIIYHFEIHLPDQVFYCSAVQKMVSDDRIPIMPWDRFATDLGVNIVYENIFGPLEIITSSQLSCAVAIIPITTDVLAEEKSLWVVQSFDQTGLEADDNWLRSDSDEDGDIAS